MRMHDLGSTAARVSSPVPRRVLPASFTAWVAAIGSWPASAGDRELVKLAKYLTAIGSCTDCHTPGHFLG